MMMMTMTWTTKSSRCASCNKFFFSPKARALSQQQHNVDSTFQLAEKSVAQNIVSQFNNDVQSAAFDNNVDNDQELQVPVAAIFFSPKARALSQHDVDSTFQLAEKNVTQNIVSQFNYDVNDDEDHHHYFDDNDNREHFSQSQPAAVS
jgi:hypothetical protein